MQKSTILVVEDEDDILEVIEYNLHREGFDVFTASDGEAGLDLARQKLPDLALLDLMLPGIAGTEVCRLLKQDDNTRSIPIIMVTAKGEEDDIVAGLELGADDYLTKPFSPRELVARVKAVLRRSEPVNAADDKALAPVQYEGLLIDPGQHIVKVEGVGVTLTATEFTLLYILATYPGRVFTRDQLITRVMGDKVMVIDRNIDVHIRGVRKKLGNLRDLIETVRGVGYRFCESGTS